jgi:hypothetical protein
MAASTPGGVKGSTMATRAPARMGASSAPLTPKEWDRGRVASTQSAAVSPITGPAQDTSAASSAAWESTAPLGRPVLPEV